MLKKYLKDNHISMYKLASISEVPYSTLNDSVNHKLPVENMKSGQLFALSKALGISMNELYDLCLYTAQITSEKYNIDAVVSIRHKTYWLTFVRNGKTYEDEIIPVKQEASRLIQELAKWKLDECIEKLIMEDVYETIHSKKI